MRGSSKPNCLGPPRWIRSRCRQPKSLTRPRAACRSPPSVQLTPRVLIHQALARSDRLARPGGVMSIWLPRDRSPGRRVTRLTVVP